jgi:hypothetical protein
MDPKVAEDLAHELLERLRPLARAPWGAEAFAEARRIAVSFLVERLGPSDRIVEVVAKHCQASEKRVAFDVRAILEELAEPKA